MVNIAIFDDSKERCDSLSLLISQSENMKVVGTFPNAMNACAQIKECQAELVLMDIDMPGINGIDATRLLKSAFSDLIILMQTISEDDDNLFKSIQAGASGYILKKTHPEKIITAINDAVQGGAPLSPAMAFKMLKYFQVDKKEISPADQYGISKREKEILASLVEGNSYKMIGEQLFISYHTVNSHIRNIYEKLHVHSLGEAIRKTLKEDLLN